jgi:SAM-dependent methyltransferase
MTDLKAKLEANQDQIDYWNADAGRKWVAHTQALDLAMEPITQRLLKAAAPKPGERALDIGCGCGETTLTVARAVAPNGAIFGVDISEQMLSEAKRRAKAEGLENTAFALADAAALPLTPDHDLIISRFGVMFFHDPIVAFKNIHSGLSETGRLAFVCWRHPKENGWATAPFWAVKDLLPEQPPFDPDAPGPFSLHDDTKIKQVLSEAGFSAIEIQPFDTSFRMASEGGAKTAVEFVSEIGPLARAMAEVGPDVKSAIVQRLHTLFEPLVRDDALDLPAAVWIVTATG